MLSDRADITLAAAKAELVEFEKASRQRIKTLKALIRVLEAEKPSQDPEGADFEVDSSARK
jgi:hypothetical protein